MVRIWSKLIFLHKKYQIISILSYWLNECAFIGDRFSKLKDVRHYCWLLGQDARPGNKFIKKIAPSARSLVAISETLAETFYQNYNVRPAHIIPAAIDESEFEINSYERSIDIIAVGSLIPLKDHSTLIDVMRIVALEFPNVTAVICGKGPEENNLVKKIRSYGLEKNISLIGEMPRKEVLQLMQRSKILLHTSGYEGFGLVLSEALYAGAHVISFTKPMRQQFEHFTQVNTASEMIFKTIALLKQPLIHTPVSTYKISDSIKLTSELLNIQDAYVEINLPETAFAES
jgi:glycosyltransferase involved in cell wall biosynthesis